MKRIKLTIAYDGTGFSGWQKQQGRRTVEGELSCALTKLTGSEAEAEGLIGCSRTDAGVHALGNTAVFDTDCSIPPEKFARALNTFLPEDIRVTASEEVPARFHPRKQSSVKTYSYSIYNSSGENPLKRLYSSFCSYRLDTGAMRTAARLLEGEHDFTSFANPDSQVLKNGGSAVRKIYSIEIYAEDEAENGGRAEGYGFHGDVRITVRGSGFLYNMVRIIAGTLIDVGRGKIAAESMTDILEARDRRKAGPTAPARGLVLVSVSYPEN